MGVIQCCGALRKSKTFILEPHGEFLFVRLDWLESCPCCSHTVLQLTRLDYKNTISVVRKVNQKARILRSKLENAIISEVKQQSIFSCRQTGTFFLMCNEFGRKTKCFSNLSQLKMGISENAYLKPSLPILKTAFGF